MGQHLLSVTWIIGTNPYKSSVVIISLIVIGFCLSIVMTFRNWSAERRERRQRQELYRRVQTLENNQGQMLEILNEWRRYTEMRRNAYIWACSLEPYIFLLYFRWHHINYLSMSCAASNNPHHIRCNGINIEIAFNSRHITNIFSKSDEVQDTSLMIMKEAQNTPWSL